MLKLVLIAFPVLITVPFMLWHFIFKPLFGLQSKLSVDIREKIIPDIQNASNSITMLSSAAILLTFSIIQIWGDNLSYKNILIFSWFGFTCCIFTGVIIGIITYTFRTHYLVMIKAIEDLQKNKEIADNAKKLLSKSGYFQKVLFVLVFLQPVVFFISMFCVVLFAVKSI